MDPDAVHAREGPRRLGRRARRRAGQARPVARSAADHPGGMLAIGEGDEVTALRELARPMVALYVGGMGAKGKNFYNDVVCRYGFEEEAEKIQELYLDGKKTEAEALVPDELLEADLAVRPRGLCGRAHRRLRRRPG